MLLFLVRHAESNYGTTDDHSRPLSEFGVYQASLSATFIKDNINHGSTQIIASDATRTLTTAKHIQNKLNHAILSHATTFYHARASEWCDAIMKHHTVDHLILVGHNPTMGFLSRYLNPQHAQQFCPASVSRYKLEIAEDGLKLPAQFIDFFTPDAK